MYSIQPFQNLFKAVEALGGQTPAAFTAVLDTLAAYHVEYKYTGPTPHDSLLMAADSGVALTADQGRDQLLRMAKARFITQHGYDFRQLQVDAAILLGKMLRNGDAGDELLASLRPVVAEAMDGISAASAYLGPDTTAEQIVDMPPAAVEAYQRAKNEYAPLLDRVLFEVIRPLTLSANDMEVLPGQNQVDAGYLMALWFIDPTKAYLIEQVGILFSHPVTKWSMPGGRWLAVNELTGLRLNTPREAIAILNALVKQRRGEEMARYAPQTLGPDGKIVAAPRRPEAQRPARPAAKRQGSDTEELPVNSIMDDGFEETSEIDPNAVAGPGVDPSKRLQRLGLG
jgi:hypothetical protein